MGIGQTFKKKFGSGGQTTNSTTAQHPSSSIEGRSGNQKPGGTSNLRSQNDTNVDPRSVFGSNRQADYEPSSKIVDGESGILGRGDKVITSHTAPGAGNKEYVSPNGLGGIGRRGANDADYANRGFMGPGATGATTGTQDQRRASDIDSTGFGGGTMKTTSPTHRSTGHRVENTNNESNHLPTTLEKEHNHHVHHVEPHAPPVIDKDMKNEAHQDKGHHINTGESRANKPNEIDILQGEIRPQENSVEQGQREHTVIDQGESVNKREIHHVHHVVQPIVNKETIEQHRIHTTIPIHQVTHEAPIVHKSQSHAPVSMEHFTQRGGQITGGLTYDQIGSTVLRSGECTREVVGEGENVARELTGSGLSGPAGHFGRQAGGFQSGTGTSCSGAAGASNKGMSTGLSKQSEPPSTYGSQQRATGSYGGRTNIGLKDTDPITSEMGAGMGPNKMGPTTADHDHTSGDFFQRGGN